MAQKGRRRAKYWPLWGLSGQKGAQEIQKKGRKGAGKGGMGQGRAEREDPIRPCKAQN